VVVGKRNPCFGKEGWTFVAGVSDGLHDIDVLSFVRKEEGKPLIFAICRIVFHSLCLICGVRGNWCLLLRSSRKPANCYHPLGV
jgi:hypothetical protein